MLYTNLRHITTADEYRKVINDYDNVVICCGRMDSLCIPVYNVLEQLGQQLSHVIFFDLELENPEFDAIKCAFGYDSAAAHPFVLYIKNGEIVKRTSGFQKMEDVNAVLRQEFGG